MRSTSTRDVCDVGQVAQRHPRLDGRGVGVPSRPLQLPDLTSGTRSRSVGRAGRRPMHSTATADALRRVRARVRGRGGPVHDGGTNDHWMQAMDRRRGVASPRFPSPGLVPSAPSGK